jgi:Nif-specific regulatory protein
MRVRLLIDVGIGAGREWTFGGDDTIKLGRSKGNSVVIHDQHASRWHAEIFPKKGRWFLRDCNSVNGTRLNGKRVSGETPLHEGQEIRIGDTRLRVFMEPSESPTDEVSLSDEHHLSLNPPARESDPNLESSSTVFEQDELSSLLGFLNASLGETTAAGVVTQALQVVHRQVHATVSGFLSLEEDDPLPKLVLPLLSKVDIHLSRELTQRVQRDGRTAWLSSSDQAALQTDSLVSYQDAICVPVHAGDAPLGALHVYRSGAVFRERDVRFCEALAGSLARCLHCLRSRHALEADNSRLREHSSTSGADLVGNSPPMKQLKQQIRRLAEGPKVVLISGESGSGKELVALALHRQSRRHEGPLVTVNCAAIAASMPEAELFGHMKGAFTGAESDRPGYFQQADMGTLFLDEIGELSEDCQAKVLRVMENGSFRAVGGRVEQKVDVRIIAATNRDLERECKEGHFRRDLFFRLGLELKVPPLRDRRHDIPILVDHFLARLAVEYRRPAIRLSPAALERLQEYHWPGNVRQLRSVLEHAVAMSEHAVIEADELHLFAEGAQTGPLPMSLNLEELEKWAIRQALERTHGTITQAARLLGIHRDTLMAKMKKYDIEKGN